MATITSTQTGNFADGATWVGGAAPGANDTAVADNGHVVTIAANATCVKVTQVGTGKFVLPNGITLTANVEANAGTFTSGGTVEVTATTTAGITGNITGTSTTTANVAGVVVTGTGALTVNGDVTGSAGNVTLGNSNAGIYADVAASITVNGVVTGGSGGYKCGVMGGSSSGALAITVSKAGATAVTSGSYVSACAIYTLGASTTITVTGNVTGVGNNYAYGICASGASATVTVTGNVTGGSGTSAHAIETTGASATVTVTGNVTGGSGTSAHGINASGASATVTVTGNVTGGSNSSARGIYATGASATVIVTGTVTGGGNSNAYAIETTGASATVIVTGTVTGGGAASAYGICAPGNGSATITVTGNVTAGTGDLVHGIYSTNTGSGYFRLVGNATDHHDGSVAYNVRRLLMSDTANNLLSFSNYAGYPNGAPLIRASLDYASDVPAITDVRDGVVYADDQYTGTCHVPDPSAVGVGVPVDATVGTAAVTTAAIAAAVWGAVRATYDDANSFGATSEWAGAVDLSPVQEVVDDIASAIGTPIAVDSGTASLAGMLRKMFDDGSGYDATSHSLYALSSAVMPGVPTANTATGNTLTTGTNYATGGGAGVSDYTATYLDNGAYWVNGPVSPAVGGFGLNAYLTFGLGTRTPNTIAINGRFTAASARYCNVYAYNYVTAAWDQLSDANNRMNHSASADLNYSYVLLNAHKDPETNACLIGFRSPSTTTTDRLYIDQVIVNAVAASASASQIAAAVWANIQGAYLAYDGGIWVDSENGEAGVEIGVNGLPTNPVTTEGDARTLAAALGVRRYYLKPGTTLTLAHESDYTGWRFIGSGGGSVALNDAIIEDCVFEDLYEITGAATGDDIRFDRCGLGDGLTVDHCYAHDCMVKGTINLIAAGAERTYFFTDCSDAAPASTTCGFAFGSTGNELYLRDFHGGVALRGMASDEGAWIDGAGRVIIEATCVAGSTVAIRGNFDVADSGSATITETANTPTRVASVASTLAAIKGATWDEDTDTLEALRDRGDSAWITATGFATPTNVTDAAAAVIEAIPAVDGIPGDTAALILATPANKLATDASGRVTPDEVTPETDISGLATKAEVLALTPVEAAPDITHLTSDAHDAKTAAEQVAALVETAGGHDRFKAAALETVAVDLTGVALTTDITAAQDAIIDAVEAVDPFLTVVPGAYEAGTAGYALGAAGSAADPLLNPVPGEYETGSAGYALGTMVANQEATQEAAEAAQVAAEAAHARVDTFNPTTLTVQSPVAADGTTITIYAGDSYPLVHGRSGIAMQIPDVGHAYELTGAGVVVKLKAMQMTWTAATVTSTAAGWTITWTPTAAQTAVVTKTQYYEVEATYPETPPPDNILTLAKGLLECVLDIPVVTR